MFLVACDEETGGEYPITKLVISTLPKTEYYVGDKFELENAQLTVYYENDTKDVVDLTLNMISEFSTTEIGEQTLTIKYKEAVTYLTINVLSAPVYSIQVESTDHKTEYVVGEQLDVDGLKLLVTYSNGYTSVIDVTVDMITGFSTESTGEKQIVISYGSRTCNMAIQVVRRSVMQMQLVAPSKLDYIVGDVIDLAEGQIFVSYNDNTSEYLNLTELQQSGDLGIVIAGEDNTTFTRSQLSCEVVLYYNDRTFSYAVTVEAKKATSAAVTTDVKAQIFESAEPDFSDGVITITYNNGEVAEKSFYDEGITLNLDQFDINRLGIYQVGINADGLYFEYGVEVVSARPAELVIIPSNETFYQDEIIDVNLWQYQIKLDNGKFNLISSTGTYYGNVTENMYVGNVEDIDTFKVGKQNLAFTLTTTDNTTLNTDVEIEVLAKKIVDVEMTSPTKVVYSVGDVINLSGAEFIVVYNNGDRSDTIAVTADMLVTENGESADLNSFTSAVQEKLTVFVNYVDNRYDTSFISDFDIKVIKKATSLEIITQPKVHYVLGETFDASDWEIIIHYSDESTVTVNDFSGTEWTFENTDFNELGTKKVRLYYGSDVYVEYTITVSNEISRIYTSKPFIGFVTEGKSVNYSDIELNVVRENGELTSMGITGDMTDFVANKVFVSAPVSYVPAYVDASVLANEDYINNNWLEVFANYYVRSDNGYVLAEQEYDEEQSYYVSVADYYRENWLEVYYNFYVFDSEKSVYSKATNQFNDELDYCLAADNVYDVNIKYLNKKVTLKLFVESKKVASISVDGIGQRYIVSDTEWDLTNAELAVNFNNNTSKVVRGSELTKLNGGYSFINNGLEYAVTIGIFTAEKNYADFSLRELVDRFANSNDQYQTENIVVKVVDVIDNNQYFTEESAVYCFENLVKSIVAVVGEYDATDVNAYQDQKVYVNEGLDLMGNAFVVDNATQRVDFEDKVYLSIAYEDGSYEYTSIRDAINVNGFEMLGYNTSKAGSQVIKISYLLSECTLALEVRANLISSLKIINQSITVVEGVKLTSGDINIAATMVDADGQPILGEVTVDLMDVTSSYDHTESINFNDKDEDGYYAVKDLKVSYGDIVSNTIQLIVRKKSLVGVSMKDMPKQIYIEDASGATNVDYTNGSIMLLYNNGTNKTVSLTDASVKIDASEFNANLELTGAGQQSQTIRISYTDENNITHNTQYNVIIKDRKYVTLNFENLPYDNKYSYQYGTGESAGPKYSVTYYQSFDGESTNMSRGNGGNGTYELVYINNATGYSQEEWPTEVGVYTLSVSYDGDAINNEFFDNSVTIEILRKEIVIKVNDHKLTYGEVFEGNSNADIGFEWEMKGLVNGVLTDNPYCYTDTSSDVVAQVEFDIINTLGSEIIFRSLTVDNVSKFVINANTGEYVIVPKVTLKSPNYYISETYTNVNASLVIEKRDVIVVSTDTSKIYGSNNPEFKYEVFDYVAVRNYLLDNGDISDISELSEDRLQTVDFDSIKNAQNKVLPFGNHNRLYYFFAEDYSNLYNGDGNFDVDDQSVIFSDNAIAQYRLTRPVADNENVGEHTIYGGDGNILPNYTIYFVKGTLDIEKADLEIDGSNISRYYGTTAMKPQYSIAGQTSLKYFDSFDELFGDYFDVDDVIFYNKVSGAYVRQITDNYYDDWCILYKNVKIFADEQCTESVGFLLENATFSVAGVQYVGSYTALPVDLAVGEYYVVVDFANLDLHNYEVNQYVENGKEYAFTINIQQVDVSINVESIIVAENEQITDDNSRFLSSYFEFESNGLKVNHVSRDDLVDGEYIDSAFKNKVLSVRYNAKSGEAIDYVLSDSYLTNNYTFYKKDMNNLKVIEETKEDVNKVSRAGTYTIGIASSCDNYSIKLSSLYVEHNQNYVDFFHSIWGLRYEISSLQDNKASFDTDAYMLVLPTYANVAYGNGEANLHSEVYNKVDYSEWTIDTFMDKTGGDYVSLDKTGISFSITNKDEIMNSLGHMVAGSYDGIMTYSFFDTAEVNYLYLGDNVMLSDANAAQIINYLLFGAVGSIKYNEAFEYEVTPIVLDTTILGAEVITEIDNEKTYNQEEEVYFDESEKVVAFNLVGSKIFDDDAFSFKFNVEVIYNARTETHVYENVELSAYRHKFNNANVKEEATINKAVTAFKLLNAGTYKVKLVELGNMNYAIGDNVDCTITILSINLPIYFTENIVDKGNPFTITRPYTGKQIQPIDYGWKAAADMSEDYSYGSTTCKIVKNYHPLGGGDPVTTMLAAAPRTLMVYAADENGNYPVNVKKDGDEIDGYDISYHISSDYVNYSVVFVYYDGTKYVECEGDKRYKLVIEPKNTFIFNFHKVNTKVYDGTDAEINAVNRNIITVMEDEITENKQNIVFTFERVDAEGSTYIADKSGKRYELIDRNDISSVGTLKVKAYYSDNFSLLFDKGFYKEGDKEYPEIGVYTITKKSVNFDLYGKRDTVFAKEYDYYGLTSGTSINYTGDFNDIAVCQSANSVIDDYSTLLYALEVKYFNDELNMTNIQTAEAINPYTYSKSGIESGYDIGYYWFNLRGVFEHNGEKIKFSTINEGYSNWLSWNYTYKVADTNSAMRNGCDGVFHIKQRQVYLIINPDENENGIIQPNVSNVPRFEDDNYEYQWQYNGTTYTSSMLTEDINTQGGSFGYGLYVKAFNELTRSDVFVNINKYSTIGDITVGYTFDYSSKQLVFAQGTLVDKDSGTLDIGYQDVFTVNPNFVLVNTNTKMRIVPLELEVEVKLANSLLDGKSEITYNDTDTSKILTYEINPLNVYPNSIDTKIQTAESIIELVGYKNGKFFIDNKNTGKRITYEFKDNQNNKNGLLYLDSPSSFYGYAAGTYTISGADLGENLNRYNINIVSVDFVINPKPISVIGIERTYFDKQFANYTFTYEGEYNKDISDILSVINFCIEDNTNIDASVNTYVNNKEYYVTIPKEDFVSIDPSYKVVLGTNFVPDGADTSTYVYIPLTINKANIKIDVSVNGEVEFGDLITTAKYNDKYSVKYEGFEQLLSTNEYTYVNTKTGEVCVDYYDSNAQSIQNDFIATIEGTLIKKDDIVDLIASTPYSEYLCRALLEEYVTNTTPVFANFTVEWGEITYTIIKKLVDIEINANVSYHKNLSGSITGYFSALWSEKDELFYNPNSNEKLSYSVKVSDFALKETNYSTLEEQIRVIFNLSVNADNQYVSGRNTYDTIDEFLASILNYIIVDKVNDTVESTAAGLRNIKICGLVSDNFQFNYIAEPIMLYPEIESIGEYNTEEIGNYVNVISDSESIADGVTISEATREINGLSMYVQFNLNGSSEDSTHQYYDVKTYSEFDTDSYSGMNYTRELKVYYLGKANGDSNDLTINVGDYVYAQIVVTETFYASDYDVIVVNEIVSNAFIIKFMKKSDNNVIMDVVTDKYDGGLKSQSSNEVENFDTLLDNITDSYYYNVTETGLNFEDTFDMLTVRAKLLSKSNASKYSYEIIVYENDYGKLVFGVSGGEESYYYVKMKYNGYYTLTTHTTAQVYNGVQYYTFSQINSLVEGEDISTKEYYCKSGNGYERVLDTEADLTKVYYEKVEASLANGSALVADYYVDFSENVISESLVEMFDGANHTINIQIDTLGEIVNVKESIIDQTSNIDGVDHVLEGHTIIADKKYYLYVTVDSVQYVFSYIGGAYNANYKRESKVETYYILTADTAAVEGKTYYTFNQTTVSSREELKSGDYYAYNSDTKRYIPKTLYIESLQYYTIETMIGGEIADFSNVYEKVVDSNNSEGYTVDTSKFFVKLGNTGISLHNVYAQVTKYSIKDRLLLTATNQNYMADVILWPTQSDNGEQVYIVSESSAENVFDSVKKTLQKIALITMAGGTVDDNAYNSAPNIINTNNRITYTCTVTNYRGVIIAGDIIEPGMYLLNYSVVYNYGPNYSTIVYENTIKFIVTTSKTDRINLYEYTLNASNMIKIDDVAFSVSNSSPYNLNADEETKYYYSDNLEQYSSSTIAFDNFNFTSSTGEIWLYLRTSNVRMTSFISDLGIDGLYKEVGFAFRAKLVEGSVEASLYLNVYDRESNANTISVYSPDSVKIDLANKVNIVKVDYVELSDVNYIVFRMYQKDVINNETALVWQEYLKASQFDKVTQGAIDQLMYGVGTNSNKYMGLSLSNASMRLLTFDTGRKNKQGADFVKYQRAENLIGEASTGTMYMNDALEGKNNVFMYTDAFDIPYAFVDETIQIKFSFPEGVKSNADGFDFHFANATPYINASSVDSTVIGQRSVYLRYVQNTMLIGFAKYDDDTYLRYDLSSSIKEKAGVGTLNEYFMDGNAHTITLRIDRSRAYRYPGDNIYMANAPQGLKNMAERLQQYYMIFIKIDNLPEIYAVCPYLNNLAALGDDPETDYNGRDKYFINGLSYLGITLHSDTTKLKIHDVATF